MNGLFYYYFEGGDEVVDYFQRLRHNLFFIFYYAQLYADVYEPRGERVCKLGEEHEKGDKYRENEVYRKPHPAADHEQRFAYADVIDIPQRYAEYHKHGAYHRERENAAEIAYQHHRRRIGNVYALRRHIVYLHGLAARGKWRYPVVKLAQKAGFYCHDGAYAADYRLVYYAEFEAIDHHYADDYCKQKERARAERLKKNISGWSADLFGELTAAPTVFTGYDTLIDTGVVVALSDEETLTDGIATDDQAKEGVLVVLDKTPFYAEMGGQTADHGVLTGDNCTLRVLDVKKTPKGYFVHTCVLENGFVRVGDTLTAQVDREYRWAIARNHTATHLLQAALREVLGDHVHQAGSYQDAHVTHFDFTHFSAVTPEELAKVERIVNDKIFEALDVQVRSMPLDEAKKMGAMALFGEKYGEIVRVVDVCGWSTEFCGGTHVSNTAQLGCFKILSESSVAAGVRRIEGTTGFGVLRLLDERTEMLHKVAGSLKVNNLKDLPLRAEGMAAEVKSLTKELEQVKAEVAASKIDGLFENAAEVNGIHIVSAYLSGTAPEALRGMCEKIRDKAPNAVGALIGTNGEKITLAVGVGKEALARGLKAGALVKQIAAIAGGNGGGKPDFAMAGIKDAAKVDAALQGAVQIVNSELEKNG